MNREDKYCLTKKADKKFKRMKSKLKEKHGDVAVMLLECFSQELLPKNKVGKPKELLVAVSRWLKLWQKELKKCHEPECLFTWTCHVCCELTRRSFSVWDIVSGKISENAVEHIARSINKKVKPFMEELGQKAKA